MMPLLVFLIYVPLIDAVIKMGLSDFATQLNEGTQKSQIDHYIKEI